MLELRRAAWRFAVALSLVSLAACAGDDDADVDIGGSGGTGGVGGETGGAGASTAGSGGGGGSIGGSGGTGGMMVPVGPGAPSITSPMPNESINTPLMVTGVGLPGAHVTARLFNGAIEIGAAMGSVDANGDFALAVDYAANQPSAGTELALRVTLTDAGMTSPTTELSVIHQAIELSGQITQSGGSTAGAIYVRLYRNAGDVLEHIRETAIPQGTALPAGYSFQVAAGTYYVRAFRDVSGPGGVDLQPTLPTDPQAPAVGPVVVASPATADLTLQDATGAAYYFGFNAFTDNESAEAAPPYYEDPGNPGSFLPGTGFCRGFHMTLWTFRLGNAADLSAPQARVPGQSEPVTLLNDGGCGAIVHNNTASSYDSDATDDSYSYGWPDPDGSVGNYTFFYRNTALDLINIQVDAINSIQKLTRNTPLTAPTGATPLVTATPLIQWSSVPGAASYQVTISDNVNGATYFHTTAARFVGTSYQVPVSSSLSDDLAYRVSITSYDAPPSAGDFDARSFSIPSYFVRDSAMNSTTKIFGSILNNTDTFGDVRVIGIDTSGYEASSIVVPQNMLGGGFSLYVLKPNGGQTVGLRAFLDADLSGEANTRLNDAYGRDYTGLTPNFGSDISQAVAINAIVNLLTPVDGAVTTATPLMQWQGYGTHAPAGNWSYVLIAVDVTGAFGELPTVMWALPNTTNQFDWSAPPANKTDMVAIATSSMNTNPSNLSGSMNWAWGVYVIPCIWDNSDSCISDLLTTDAPVFAKSPLRDLMVP